MKPVDCFYYCQFQRIDISGMISDLYTLSPSDYSSNLQAMIFTYLMYYSYRYIQVSCTFNLSYDTERQHTQSAVPRSCFSFLLLGVSEYVDKCFVYAGLLP